VHHGFPGGQLKFPRNTNRLITPVSEQLYMPIFAHNGNLAYAVAYVNSQTNTENTLTRIGNLDIKV
jgi:hypothetical protein